MANFLKSARNTLTNILPRSARTTTTTTTTTTTATPPQSPQPPQPPQPPRLAEPEPGPAPEDEWVLLGEPDYTDAELDSPSGSRTFEVIHAADAATIEYGFTVPVLSDERYTKDTLHAAAGEKEWARLGSKAACRSARAAALVVEYGIPQSLRGSLWPAYSGAEALQLQYAGVYDVLVAESDPGEPAADSTAAAAADAVGSAEDVARIDADRAQIELDLRRTFPNNTLFSEHADPESAQGALTTLRSILVAFSRWTPIGYCQSLNYIAGLLMLVLDSPERALWTLSLLVESTFAGYYSDGMPRFIADVAVLNALINEHLPETAAVLAASGFDLSMVCAQWLLCLFVNTLPLPTVLRVWDATMYFGGDTVLKTAFLLVQLHAEDIVAAGPDFEAIHGLLTSLPRLPHPNDLIAAVHDLRLGDITTIRDQFLPRETIAQLHTAAANHRARFAAP